MGSWRLLSNALIVLILTATLLPRTARAQAPHPIAIHILEIDSEDANDQAEALTGALRSRIRATSGWSVLETTQSLSMLTAALRCPPHPDPPCLQRIADQLKAEHFIWGLMGKNAQHEVVAEVHLWTRGKPERVAKETYSENLKDQNDDSLRRIANQIFERLGGGGPGTLVLTAGAEEGAVLVDGEQRAQLDHGHATLQVAPGPHVIEVRGPTLSAKQNVTVTSNATAELNFPVEATQAPPPPEPPSKPFPTRAVLGWTTVVAGVGMLAVGGVGGVSWLKVNSDMNSQLSNVMGPVCPTNVPQCAFYNAHNQDSKLYSALFFGFGGAGLVATITGAYLLLAGHHSDEAAPGTQPQVRLLPHATPGGGGLDMSITF